VASHHLISAEELSRRRETSDPAVVDCRFNLSAPEEGESQYLAGHIPGAVYAHLDRDLSGERTGRNGRHPLPRVEDMAERFSRWGIDASVAVVAYDADSSAMAARLWWMLRYLGHDRVSVLDGGIKAWKEAGLPLRAGREERAPRVFSPRVQASLRVDASQVLDPAGSGIGLLVDARAPERYRGDEEPLDPVAGHIPGAVNHFYATNLDARGRFLPPEELGRRYRALLGGAAPESVVVYCGSGVTACHNLLSMAQAGLTGPRLYPGSWSEWCSDPARPVETGSASSG
jgi:thiosulfate/3-mercaptopyruvate sulfurtransferase